MVILIALFCLSLTCDAIQSSGTHKCACCVSASWFHPLHQPIHAELFTAENALLQSSSIYFLVPPTSDVSYCTRLLMQNSSLLRMHYFDIRCASCVPSTFDVIPCTKLLMHNSSLLEMRLLDNFQCACVSATCDFIHCTSLLE